MHAIDDWVTTVLSRLPMGAKLAAMQNRLASFGEQGMQGAANLIVNAILARSLTHQGFATIGVMLGIHYFVLGIHRTVVVLAFILDASHATEGNEGEAQGRWWWLNLASIALIAAILLAATLLAQVATASAPHYAWFVDGLGMTVAITPCLLFFEFGRRVLYQLRLPVTAALASAVYLVLNLSVAMLAMRTSSTPWVGGLAWIVAGLGGGAIATLAAPPGRPALRAGFDAWWAHRNFAFWQGLTNFPYAVYNSSVVVVVGLFGGSDAAAAFTATRTLTNPAISMVTAVDSLDKPRAARGLAQGGLPGLHLSIGRTRRLLALITGVYLGLLILFAGPALHFAFGDAYANHVTEIRVLALAFFLICMNQPSETRLIVLKASRLMLVQRIIAAVIAVISLALAGPWGLMGICVALLVTHAINLAMLHIAERLADRKWRIGHPVTTVEKGAAIAVTAPMAPRQ